MNPEETVRALELNVELLIEVLNEELTLLREQWAKEERRIFKYSLLFEGLELNVLEGFIDLLSNLYKRIDELFAEFALRTLAELSFKKIHILFSSKLSKEEKLKYKLLITIVDIGKLSLSHKKNIRDYILLLRDKSYLLTDKQSKHTSSLARILIEGGSLHNGYGHIIKMRRLINNIQDNLSNKAEEIYIPHISQKHVLLNEWSHLLHGNIFMNLDLFNEERPPGRHKLRMLWALNLCGLNVVQQVGKRANSSQVNQKVDKIIAQFDLIKTSVESNYKIIEKNTH